MYSIENHLKEVKESISSRKVDNLLHKLENATKYQRDHTVFSYNDKILICGDYIRHYHYETNINKGLQRPVSVKPKPKTLFTPLDLSLNHLRIRSSPQIIINPLFFRKGIEQTQRRVFSITRTRNNLFNTISSNQTQFSKILTLTTKQEILDRSTFLKMFKTFLQRFQRTFNYRLKYIGILERQLKRGLKMNNKGSIHIHLIIFTKQFIPYEILKEKCWTINDGSIDIKKVQQNGLAKYLSKYLTKQNTGMIHELGQKAILKSRGLIEPKIIYHQKPNQLPYQLKRVYKTAYQIGSIEKGFTMVYLVEYSIIRNKLLTIIHS